MSEKIDEVGGVPPKKLSKSEKKAAKYEDEVKNYSVESSSRIPKEGIYKDRGCTDLFCLIVFLAFMGTMMGLTIHGFIEGNPEKFVAPFDHAGKFCGHDEGLIDYPYLYLPNLDKTEVVDILNTGICVDECPTPEKPYGEQEDNSYPINTGSTNMKDGPAAVDGKITYDQVFITKAVLHYCIPNMDKLEGSGFTQKWKAAYAMFLENPAGKQLNNMYLASTSIYLSCFMALVFCLVYIKVMSIFAETIAWAIVILVQIGFFVGSGACFYGYFELDLETGDKTDLGSYVIAAACALLLMGLLFMLAICCFRDSLSIAIDIIDASADFLDDTKKIIGVPVVFFFIQIICIIVWLLCMACINSMGKFSADLDAKFPQQKSIETDPDLEKKVFYMNLYMFFGILWICQFLKAKTQFITMVSASTYYFNSDKETEGHADLDLAVQFTYKFHIGSLAFGSFIIALVEFIKWCFLVVAEYAATASGENKMVKVIIRVAECYITCLEKVCDYINKSAYCYMAVSGDGFCKSAWNGFLLNMKHAMKFAFANFLAQGFILLGKLGIVAINLVFLYLIMKVRGDIEEVGPYGWMVPAFVVGAITYIAASVFLGLFDETVLALVTSLCVDVDLNGKPKYGPPTFHETFDNIIGDDSDDDAAKNHYKRKPTDNKNDIN